MKDKLTLYNLFENHAGSTSSHIIYCDGIKKHSITFKELRDQVHYISEQLENLLLSKSVVVCLMKPTHALPAVLLGILKASSTFAFLDVYIPHESLKVFEKHLEVKTLLVEECFVKSFQSKLCPCWKKIKEFTAFTNIVILQSSECENAACANTKKYKKCDWQSEIAYALQTSGTTGEPKVVQVPHDCIAPNIVDFRSRFSVTAEDVILQSTSITFDPSIMDIFLALSSGATLVIIAEHLRASPKKLLEILVSNDVTILQGTPACIANIGERNLKEILLGKQTPLRILAFGGEACPSVNKLRRWKCEGNETEIYNLYGLSEASCWGSCFKIDFSTGDSLPSIPIGEAVLKTNLEIRDEEGCIADKGELYIGGHKRFCILNDEEWPKNPDTFMRATGDFVYKAPNGFIYFQGRNDSIIKYMGHEIPLQLVTNIVHDFCEVDYHLAHFDIPSAKLYLFVVWSSNRCESEIERDLKECLKAIPNLPAVIVFPVPFIPVTKHGKWSVKQLMSLVNNKKRFCTEDASEECCDILSTLWKKYTSQFNITESDMFIINGGNSIYAIQFASEVGWHFQLALPLLIEKILNEPFKEICSYVTSCLKESNEQSRRVIITLPFYEHVSHFKDSTSQPSPNMKCYDKSQCFNHGYLEDGIYIKASGD